MARSAFEIQLAVIKQHLLQFGKEVEHAIGNGAEALQAMDRRLAENVIQYDEVLNNTRYEIEKSCYALIATQQPLASDMREVISILLITIELERIADHAKNLAEIEMHMTQGGLLRIATYVPRMAAIVQQMLDQALDAFSRNDAEMARAVCDRDDEIDHIYRQLFHDLLIFVADNPRQAEQQLNLLFAAHNLERIGDCITNIGERTIYAVTGKLEELNVQKVGP